MFRSLGDLLSNNTSSRNNERDRPIESFAGGERSGLAIQQPNDGHENATAVLKLYRDGFTLEDGPFRPLSDPVNRKFVEAIEKGDAPVELRDRAGFGQMLDLSLIDLRDRDYEPPSSVPQVRYTLFGGAGQSLTNSSTSTLPQQELCEAPEILVDPCLPQTSLAIHFPDGTRTIRSFNTAATIAELRCFVSQVLGPSSSFALLIGFPPKCVEYDDAATLQEAGIMNTKIIVRLQ